MSACQSKNVLFKKDHNLSRHLSCFDHERKWEELTFQTLPGLLSEVTCERAVTNIYGLTMPCFVHLKWSKKVNRCIAWKS